MQWPERRSIFSDFSAHADGEHRGLNQIGWRHRKGLGETRPEMPSNRHGSSALSVGMLRDIGKKALGPCRATTCRRCRAASRSPSARHARARVRLRLSSSAACRQRSPQARSDRRKGVGKVSVRCAFGQPSDRHRVLGVLRGVESKKYARPGPRGELRLVFDGREADGQSASGVHVAEQHLFSKLYRP